MRLPQVSPVSAAPRMTQLDGVRGLLALYVLFGHVSLFMGCNFPLLNNPAIAVDLFMVLSGVFIAGTFDVLCRQHSYARAAWYFWIRRVMRIWPLYAVTLTICWLFIGDLDHRMQVITATFPRATAAAANYVAPRYQFPGLSDALLHYSMLFGLVPKLATSTPLPDWSLSLEFQFYLLFPLLYLACGSRLLLLCIVATCIAYVSPPLLGFYLEPGRFAHFEQPSALPYKLNLFLVGVLAHALIKAAGDRDTRSISLLVVALVVCLAVAGFLTTLGVALLLYLLIAPDSWLSHRLSAPALRFFGAISFTIYLVHRPLLLFVASSFADNTKFVAWPAILRFAMVGCIVFALTILVAWGLYVLIERPGNRLGHHWTTRSLVKSRPAATLMRSSGFSQRTIERPEQ